MTPLNLTCAPARDTANHCCHHHQSKVLEPVITADKELGLRCGFAKLGVSLQLDSGMTVTEERFSREQEAMTWRPECPDGTPQGTSGGRPPTAVPQSPVWRAGEADGRRGALAVSGLACWLPWLTQPPSLTRRSVCRHFSYDTVTEPFLFLSVS